jgi:hypothetical protein
MVNYIFLAGNQNLNFHRIMVSRHYFQRKNQRLIRRKLADIVERCTIVEFPRGKSIDFKLISPTVSNPQFGFKVLI